MFNNPYSKKLLNKKFYTPIKVLCMLHVVNQLKQAIINAAD